MIDERKRDTEIYRQLLRETDVPVLSGCVFFTPVFGISTLFLHMCILSAVCLHVLCWTSRLSEKGARSRASPVNRALWPGMADSCWPRPRTAAGCEFAALPWHVWNDPAVVYCAALVWFTRSYGGPPCNVHPNSGAVLHDLSCVFAPLLCSRVGVKWQTVKQHHFSLRELQKRRVTSHHVPPLYPHGFHSCVLGFVVIKAETHFMRTHDK